MPKLWIRRNKDPDLLVEIYGITPIAVRGFLQEPSIFLLLNYLATKPRFGIFNLKFNFTIESNCNFNLSTRESSFVDIDIGKSQFQKHFGDSIFCFREESASLDLIKVLYIKNKKISDR